MANDPYRDPAKMAPRQPPDAETTAALVAEAIEATGCDDLSEMPVALVEDPSILAGWLRHAYRRGLAEGQAERDELRRVGRELVKHLPGAAFLCGQCDGLAMWCWPSPLGGVRFGCDKHWPEGAAELNHAPALRSLIALTKGAE